MWPKLKICVDSLFFKSKMKNSYRYKYVTKLNCFLKNYCKILKISKAKQA
jgi:hypothetical protein